MSEQDPRDGGPTTESREEKRVEVTETVEQPEPVKETVTETTETVTEPASE